MITFNDIMDTKIAMKDAWDFREKIKDTEASFDYMQTINCKTAEQVNSLIGRFFNQPKKIAAYTWKRKNKYNTTPNNIDLQISKSGMGATHRGNRIDAYTKLLDDDSYYESKGMVGDVIDDKEVYDKTFACLSEKGQDVLSALKEAREASNIKHPKSTTIKYPLKLSEDERECFNLKDKSIVDFTEDAFIELKDDYKEMVVEVKSEVAKNTNQYTKEGTIFKINNLDMNDEKDFQYFLFIHYHLKEFEDAFSQYMEKTKEHKARWTTFKELMNEKIAKYVVLYKM